MSRRRKAGIGALVVVVLLIASLVLTALILVYRPLATIDGEYRLLGLEQRADAGRLAEVLGRPAFESDQLMRTLGFARLAAQELAIPREETRADFGAYADGVNKILEQRGESLPMEFTILGYRPEKWSPSDSILVAKLQAYDAAGNMDQELLRSALVQRFGASVLDTLMPDPSGRAAAVDERAWAAVAPLLTSSAAAKPLAAFLPGGGTGSNCWALAGSRTDTGKPILAGDPHLAVRNPSI